jgi:hypothetical protein
MFRMSNTLEPLAWHCPDCRVLYPPDKRPMLWHHQSGMIDDVCPACYLTRAYRDADNKDAQVACLALGLVLMARDAPPPDEDKPERRRKLSFTDRFRMGKV